MWSGWKKNSAAAGGYLAVWCAWHQVPDAEERSNRATYWPVFYARQGMHLAFTTTLYGQLEVSRGRVNLHNIIPRILQRPMLELLAADTGESLAILEQRAGRLQRRYRRWVSGHPASTALKALRNSVVAHHGRDTESHGMRMGALHRLFARTVVVVEEAAAIVNGEDAELGDLLRFIRRESAALWAYGIDGDPAFRE